MLARLDLRGRSADLAALVPRPGREGNDVRAAVAGIITAVRERGDDALRELTRRHDGCEITDIEVPPTDVAAALDAADPDLRAALELARDQILGWHEAQRGRAAQHERLGVRVEERTVPVDRAGCYVPGGRAVYPSTVLMTAVPARVAGVPEVVVCVPPGDGGAVPDVTLAAAAIAGVDAVYRVGGAQAIAALAYGTESIAPVDVVVGPGNAYVAEAKRQVFGTVGIDSLAGPSEVAIVADATAVPEVVAADLLAQAEHGPGGAVTLVTWDPGVVDPILDALDRALAATPRRSDAAATISDGGRVVLVDDPAAAVEVVNRVAPEHLQLMCRDADGLASGVRNAGAVFVGHDASAVLGDYVAGTNHVLPTGGTARFASALRVDDFQKHLHVVTVDAEARGRLAPYATLLASVEGLPAHAAALHAREGGTR